MTTGKLAGEDWEARSPAQKLARIVSECCNPMITSFLTFVPITLMTAPNPWKGFLWATITTLGFTVIPLLFIWLGVRRGKYTDHHVSVRSQRLGPLLVALASMVVAFVLLLCLQAARPLLATMVAVIAVVLIATVITQFWKISFHLVAVAGGVTAYCLLFGPRFLVLAPFVLLVGWARWQVRAHTALQACAGTVLAVTGTIIVFRFFGLI